MDTSLSLHKHCNYVTDRERIEGNDALSHSYDQDTVIYCRTTRIKCSANQAISVHTVELHHKPGPSCSLATHTRRTYHQRIYGGIRWDQFVRSAISTTGTLTDLTTDLVVANNRKIKLEKHTRRNEKGQTKARERMRYCVSQKGIHNLFLTAQSTKIKSVISLPIKDFIHHYPRALFNDIPRVGA